MPAPQAFGIEAKSELHAVRRCNSGGFASAPNLSAAVDAPRVHKSIPAIGGDDLTVTLPRKLAPNYEGSVLRRRDDEFHHAPSLHGFCNDRAVQAICSRQYGSNRARCRGRT